MDKQFTLLTSFVPLNERKDNVHLIALGKIYSNSKSNYCLFIENIINDYSIPLIDTSGLSIEIKTYYLRRRESKSWVENDNFILYPTDIQPSSNSKGKIISFHLPDTFAFDIKNQHISNIAIVNLNYTNGNRSLSKGQIFMNKISKDFFITNSAKITTTKGSFDAPEKFKSKKIVLYSLMLKSDLEIESKIGKPSSSEVIKNQMVVKKYDTEHATYEIKFQNDIAKEIILHPKHKFKNTAELFIKDGFPFELTGCNCGEAFAKDEGTSLSYVFKDKPKHTISFSLSGRVIETIIVSEDQ